MKPGEFVGAVRGGGGMSERLSRERIEEIRVCANMRKCPLGPPCPVPAEHCDAPTMLQDALAHIAALEAEVERLRDVVDAARQAREALSLTREYVAPKVDLPAVPGWSWYDATLALDTALAALDEEVGGE